MSNTQVTAIDAHASQAFVALCAGILPVWLRQLESSRAQSETAVGQMMQAFADIGPHLHLAQSHAHKIAEALTQADGGTLGLVPACERTLMPMMKDAALSADQRQALGQVLELVRAAVAALQSIVGPINSETRQVADLVENMYEGFQYQDRISQMMALLAADMARLHEAATTSGNPVPELNAWLARLESQYAMSEQRHTHNGTHDQGTDDSKETTFF